MATRAEYEKFLRDCEDISAAVPVTPPKRPRLDGVGWFGAVVAVLVVGSILLWFATAASGT